MIESRSWKKRAGGWYLVKKSAKFLMVFTYGTRLILNELAHEEVATSDVFHAPVVRRVVGHIDA